MKTYLTSFIIGLIVLLGTGCARKARSLTPASSHTESQQAFKAPCQNKIFSGVIPCADCPGIQTELIFRDASFQLTSIYLDREAKPVTQEGLFTWNPKTQMVSLDNGQSFEYKQDQLFMLNQQNQPIEGPLSKHYILTQHKISRADSLISQLGQNTWFLKELNGQSIDSSQWTEKPFLIFSPTEKTLHGNAGCNTMFGSFGLHKDTLLLSGIASTKRFCTKMWVEDRFLKILSSDCKVTIKENLLTITNLESKATALLVKTSAKHP